MDRTKLRHQLKPSKCVTESKDVHRNAFLLYQKGDPRAEGGADSFGEGEANQTKTPQGHGSISLPSNHGCDGTRRNPVAIKHHPEREGGFKGER